MTAKVQGKVAVKHFIGVPLTPTLRIKLDGSESWKQRQLIQSTDAKSLIIIPYNNKSYIGLYSEKEKLSINDVRVAEEWIRQCIKAFCPELNANNLKASLFPQIFVS